MTDTTFVDQTTVIEADWLNDVNDHVYNSTPVSPATTVHPASVIANTPAGTIVATTVQAAIDELSIEAAAAQTTADNHIADTSAAHAASAIANTPAGNIAATNVQTALNELDTEKAALAGSASQAFSVAAATAAAYALRAGQYGSQINGWTYANNGTDPTNDLDIAAGSGLDSTRAYFISGAVLTKQSDVAWAVGTNAGMLDTGAVGDSDYYIWAIARSDTGVVDYLSSLSSTAPTMPASYDYKRLIGWFKRVGGTIVAFHTYETEGGGLELMWDAPTLDVSLTNTLTTSRRTDAIKVPLNFSVLAHIRYQLFDAGVAGVATICCPDKTTDTPGINAAQLATATWLTTLRTNGELTVRTSATGTIAAQSSVATTDEYYVVTNGFTWARRV